MSKMVKAANSSQKYAFRQPAVATAAATAAPYLQRCNNGATCRGERCASRGDTRVRLERFRAVVVVAGNVSGAAVVGVTVATDRGTTAAAAANARRAASAVEVSGTRGTRRGGAATRTCETGSHRTVHLPFLPRLFLALSGKTATYDLVAGSASKQLLKAASPPLIKLASPIFLAAL